MIQSEGMRWHDFSVVCKGEGGSASLTFFVSSQFSSDSAFEQMRKACFLQVAVASHRNAYCVGQYTTVVLTVQFKLIIRAAKTCESCVLHKEVASVYNTHCIGQCAVMELLCYYFQLASVLHKTVIATACIVV